MKEYKNKTLQGVALLFISSVFVSSFGVSRGVYVLSVNLVVLLPWLCLIAIGSSGRAKELQSRVIYLLSVMFFADLLILGLSFRKWRIVLDLIDVFGLFMMFPIIVLIFKWKLLKREKRLQYSADVTRELWGFQWLANISIALKSPEPAWIFIFLFPALLGGYMIYKAFESVEIRSTK